MKEIDLIIRNSFETMLSELHKLFKLNWQKKKCCDCKSWKYYYYYYFIYIYFLQCIGFLFPLSVHV